MKENINKADNKLNEISFLLKKIIYGKTGEEIESILQLNETQLKEHVKKSLINDGICLLKDGSYIIKPNRDFSPKKFEEIGQETSKIKSLNDAWEIIKKSYLNPHTENNKNNISGHVNTIKAIDLYPIVNEFLAENDLWGSANKICYALPIQSKFNDDMVYLMATSEYQKAFITFYEGDALRVNMGLDTLETYQDFLDNKRM